MANSYKKPLVFANEELAEGVYAASGANDAGNDSPTEGVAVTNVKLTTPGNPNYKVNVYTVTIRNFGNEAVSDWKATVSVTSGVATYAQVYSNWTASASLKGTTITITPGGGGTIPANGTIDVEVVVSYSTDSIEIG